LPDTFSTSNTSVEGYDKANGGNMERTFASPNNSTGLALAGSSNTNTTDMHANEFGGYTPLHLAVQRGCVRVHDRGDVVESVVLKVLSGKDGMIVSSTQS